MCKHTLYLFLINERGFIFVTTGKQVFPIKRDEQKEVEINGEKGIDWENDVYSFIQELCGRKTAKSIDFAKLKITEVKNNGNGNKKRNFFLKMKIPQIDISCGPFSKTNGLITISGDDFRLMMVENHIMFKGKKKDINLAEAHREIILKAFPDLDLSKVESPFEGDFFIIVPEYPAACRGDEGLTKRYRRTSSR